MIKGAKLCSGLLLACFLLSLIFLAYPLYVIRPFRYQGPRELAAALAMLGSRPAVEAGCVIAALLVTVLGWRVWTSRRSKILAAVALALTAVFAGLSRINVYEKMFHPVETPQFEALTASLLKGPEMVLAVCPGNTSRAYPIRAISYHHIVNDTVDGIPIVTTY